MSDMIEREVWIHEKTLRSACVLTIWPTRAVKQSCRQRGFNNRWRTDEWMNQERPIQSSLYLVNEILLEDDYSCSSVHSEKALAGRIVEET
jgi:hypothetical protein